MTQERSRKAGASAGGGRGRVWRLGGALALLLAAALVVGWFLARSAGAPGVAETPPGVAAPVGVSPAAGGDAPPAPAATAMPDEPVELDVHVLATYPHDPEAFTQGLVWDGGRMFESTGLEGHSSVREVALNTGEVLRKEDLPPDVFGEGLALVDDRLIQITWKNETAFQWRKDTFEDLGHFLYQGEGWGLCLDGERLVMSDGSDTLTFRDPASFRILSQQTVTLQGQPVNRLNELECVGDDVYANVWLTDWIYRIDKDTGRVNAVIDAAGLLDREQAPTADVLNGIAYRPETDTFLITGKLWPTMFEVRFVRSTAALPFAQRLVRQAAP